MYTIYEKLLQATGRTMLTTIAQIAGAATNIVLDPLLILGVGIFPLSMLRLVVIALPLAWAFSKSANADFLIWFAFPAAEGIAMLIGIWIMHGIRKSEIETMKTTNFNQEN